MRINALFVFALAVAFAGCDSSQRSAYKVERSEKFYAGAQADYLAGRLDAAAKGFAKVVKANPANASARFQLAVLQQDSAKDFLGALCNYREYISLAGESDKAGIARERMVACEKDLLAQLAHKHNLGNNVATLKELELARADLAEATKNLEVKAAKLLEAEKRIATLERENKSLSSIVQRMGADDEDVPARPREVAKVEKAQETEQVKELTVNKEALALFEEEEREAAKASTVLPAQIAKKKEAKAEEKKIAASPEIDKPQRPAYYVVQQGDTLRKIAVKFYGDVKAWERIREANKVRVPLSGSIRVGDTLKLP